MNLDDALETFIVECRELLQDMETALLGVEQAAEKDEMVNAIFRAAHTIKGSSGLFSLDHIVAFTHVVESVLDRVRAGKLKIADQLVVVLLACCDHIGSLVEAVACGEGDGNAELLKQGEPTFACVRPPGHHASRSSAWGHCTFSNVALALLHLRDSGRIRSAFVVDFDQHTGNGTQDVLRGWPEAQIFNPYGDSSAHYLWSLEERLQTAPQVDILAVSAGFDAYIHDLGHKLRTQDYFTIGRLLQAYAIASS